MLVDDDPDGDLAQLSGASTNKAVTALALAQLPHAQRQSFKHARRPRFNYHFLRCFLDRALVVFAWSGLGIEQHRNPLYLRSYLLE
jgi:hypothetical protein